MPNDPIYDAVLEVAKVHVHRAWEAFRSDERVPWPHHADTPRERLRVWIDALKQSADHFEQVERLSS